MKNFMTFFRTLITLLTLNLCLIILFPIIASAHNKPEKRQAAQLSPVKKQSCPQYLLRPQTRIRLNFGTVTESLATTVEIDRTYEAVSQFLEEAVGFKTPIELIQIRRYSGIIEEAADWDHYAIYVNNQLIGFTDGYIPVPKALLH